MKKLTATSAEVRSKRAANPDMGMHDAKRAVEREKKRITRSVSTIHLGGLSVRLIRENGEEFVEFFTRVRASSPKPVKRPKLKRRKHAHSKS